ncbi:type I restriction-modification system subunit M [Macrococcus hajekii]|uniref:site-specific DNA-methyltransferase (adenine-specific) n=1 Tax=Macrococcus hajekii TaxID=198482 RepID=A0A4R6BM24_9STAP|nr:type I restriction-modification system subunit M [Macrococcus hajekii]TDM02758.1 type I restriction-modification system subunit M [Macrococcus hajekii]GGB03647.1 type I restriction-modification system subunit M [Macrococcus hajekii]
MYTSDEIKRKLWDGANDLRGSMDASKYKDYMLGLMFYKFLSDKTLETFRKVAGISDKEDLINQFKQSYEEYGEELLKMIQDVLGYYVLPEHLYQTWLDDIRSGDFELQKVIDSLNNFERTIAVTDEMDDFKGLFSSSIIDLNNSALGSDLNKRSKNVKDLILLFADFNMVDLQEGDILGDAYEYLIGQFASNAGKKAGEFYTPRQISEIMAQIVAKTTDVTTIYDPTVGSGSLLLTVRKHLSEQAQKDLHYYGQEYITETYNLTRMNLLLHGVRPEKMNIKNGNTLAQDWPEDPERPSEGVQFDAVVMNPPYSDKRWNDREEMPLKVSDPRFADFGVLPPSTKGDFAYLMHGLFHLGQNGTMAIVLPHGVLFRGAAEGEIRKRLIEKNYIDAIIGLPGQMFTNTGIPVCVLILKKNRKLGNPVLFIDSSNHFTKIGKQNVLQEKDIARIVDTYIEKTELEGYSHLATREEMIENDYNLNIPRYVESIDNEIPQDVDGHLYGGIPQSNINDLDMLNSTVGDILKQSLDPIRLGYVQLNQSISEVIEKVMKDERVVVKSEQVKSDMQTFIDKYMAIIRTIDKETNLVELKEAMLTEVKEILSHYDYVDEYLGYQVVAEIWKNSLMSDAELIAISGFYETGRLRDKNMVTKGTGDKKRQEQDGWIGAIIPNELIVKNLYAEEQTAIEDLKMRVSEIDSELSELVESAKVEDSDEYNVLYESIKKNDEDEPQDAFDAKKVKAELKETAKDSKEYDMLKKVDQLMNEKTKNNKKIKEDEKELTEAVYERIEQLTDEEIDDLTQQKWFGTIQHDMMKLVEAPIQKELATLEMLNTRYKDTLESIDKEIEAAEKSLKELMSQLVVK